MNITYTHQDPENQRLLLVFTGWGTDPTVIPRPQTEGYDMAVAWGYDGSTPDTSALHLYQEIVIVAWSYGVAAAAQFISAHSDLPITSRIAVNGTPHPIDDNMGIPPAIYQGTHDNLNTANFVKFLRRTSGDSSLTHLAESADIEALKLQLRHIATLPQAESVEWDTAYISTADRIIPAQNQFNAWNAASVAIREIEDAPHWPQWHRIFDENLIDKTLVEQRFSNARPTYDDSAFGQATIARRLIDLWNPASLPTPADMLEIGCGTASATRQYLSIIKPKSLTLWDLTIADTLSDIPAKCEQCDAELRIRTVADNSLDLIFTTSTMQWFNSEPAFIRQCIRTLRSGGMLVASTFGPGTFARINRLSGTPSRYPTLSNLLGAMPDNCEILEACESEITLTFDTPAQLLRHISHTGVNALHRHPSAALTRKILTQYSTDANGKCPLTYHPIYLIIRKK